jgi:hypothetical protein
MRQDPRASFRSRSAKAESAESEYCSRFPMVIPPARLLPTLTMSAFETVALRRDVTVTRHVAIRHRGVHRQSPSRRGSASKRHHNSSRRGRTSPSRSEPGTSQFDIEASQPVGPIIENGSALDLLHSLQNNERETRTGRAYRLIMKAAREQAKQEAI